MECFIPFTQQTKKYFFTLVLVLTFQFAYSTIYVNYDALGIADGSSWTDAYTTLYDALAVAGEGDTIWVAAGTYYPEVTVARYSTLQLVKGVVLYGGFDGTETQVSQRDFENNITILSGDIGVIGTNSDNVYHVVTGIDTSRIDGFVIQDGYADGPDYTTNSGGGLFVYSLNGLENMVIANCTFQNNFAEDFGGAVHNYMANGVLIKNCLFKNNHFTSANTLAGGAVGSYQSAVEINTCTFSKNTSYTHGGATYRDGGTVDILNCIFEDNQTINGRGGAVYNFSQIENCVFSGNNTLQYGAAVYNSTTSSYLITNCVFSGNFGGFNGAGVTDASAASEIVNCIFLNNDCSGSAKSVYNIASNPMNVTYSRTQEIIAGTGNIIADPMFDTDSTFFLTANSPCIDAGNGDIGPALDLDGNNRYDDFGVRNTGIGSPDFADMGAYEYQQNSALNGTYTIGVSGNFTTFTEAIDSLISLGISDSVIFNVETGTYNEQLVIPEIIGTTDSTGIIFQSASGDSLDVVLTYAPTLADENYTVKLDGADYITFKSITFESTGTTYAGVVEVTNEANGIRFLNNCFIGVENTSALILNESSFKDTSVVFQNNYFLNGQNAISWYGAYYLSIKNNLFYHQSDTALYLGFCYESTMNGNLFYSDYSMTAIELNDLRTYFVVENNKIYLPNGGKGITAEGRDSPDTSIIVDNYIYMNTDQGDIGLEVKTYDGIRLKVLHNTVNIMGNSVSSVCYQFSTYAPPVTIYSDNNNFVNQAGGAVLSGAYSNGDYNNLYTTGTILTTYGNYKTLEEMQEMANREIHSVSVNPYFIVDTSWTPVHPALNNSGNALFSDSLDIEGKVRNTVSPDIGACEFTPAPVPFSGTFSVGGTTPDYETIQSAIDDLIINGVNGAIVFTLENDTFNEVLIIPEISGASETNSITFTSGVADTAVITSTYDYTLKLDGADYCTFDQVKIQSDMINDAKTIVIQNGSSHNRFTNNIIAQYASSFSNSYLIYSGSSADTNNIISGNSLINGTNGIYFTGNDTVSESNNQITGNVFINTIWKPVQIIWQNVFTISENIINNNTSVTRAINVTNSENGLIYNNMINTWNVSGAPQGIVIDNSNNQKIYYNSVRINADFNSSVALSLNGNGLAVKNNILYNEGIGYAITCADTTGFESDHNLLFSNYRVANFLGTDITDIETWQDSSGNDVNSYSFEPEFISLDDLHTDDLRLNNVGIAVTGILTDIDGENRDATSPDIGADEVNLGTPMAGEYYIGPARIFTSFNLAVDSISRVGISDSVTFLVDAGTYTEQVKIPNIPLASAEKTITFKSASGNPEDVVIQFRADSAENNYVIHMDSVTHLSFENLTINALDTIFGTAIHMINGCEYININNNIVTSESSIVTPVIVAEDGMNSDILVSGNSISGGSTGVYFIGEDGSQPTGNMVIGNYFKGQSQSGIYMRYQQWQRILNNEVAHADPIENQWMGIALFNCTSTFDSTGLVANNMIYFYATQMSAGIHLSASSRQDIYHNNVHVFGNGDNSRAFNQQEGGSSVNVQNNIFSNTANGVIIYSSDVGSVNYDYNVLYNTGSRFIYTTDWINDLSGWQAAGKGLHSLNIDPLFVSNMDLHIQETQLFGMGFPISSVVQDYDGDIRDPLNVTIGADIITTGCSGPLTGINTIGPGMDYETINDAITALISCGMTGTVVLELSDGTYNEQVYLPHEFTGKSLNDSLIIRSASGNAENVIISYNATMVKNYIIKLNGLDNFVLKDITIQAINDQYGRLVVYSGNSNNSLFEGNIFKGIDTQENNDTLSVIYYAYGSIDSSQVFRNNIFENGSKAIVKKDDSQVINYFEISGNQFIDQGYGLIDHRYIQYLNFENNVVNTETESFNGIFVGYYCDSALIKKNKIDIRANSGYFIDCQSNSSFLENNYISFYTNSESKVNLAILRDSIYLYYNTMIIRGDNKNSQALFMGSNSCQRFVQKNNVVANLAFGSVYDVLFGIGSVDSDYNNLYSNGDVFGRWQNLNAASKSFKEYLANSGLDANSVSANPVFLNDSTWYSRHVLLSNKGTPVAGITTDLNSNTRDASTPDIGAEEFEDVRYGLGEDVRVCANDSYVVNAGDGFDSYSWSTGSDSSTTKIDTIGTGRRTKEISVIATLNGNNYYDTINVTLQSPIAAPVTDYCFNGGQDSILISAGDGEIYNWNSNDTTQSIYVSGGEWHYVTVTDEYGCSSDGEIRIYYNTSCLADMGIEKQVTINDFDELTLNSNQCVEDAMIDYTWSTGEQTHSVTYTGSDLGIGTHTIWVTVANGYQNYCESSDTMNVEVIMGFSINDFLTKHGINIYPNPTIGKVFIEGENITKIEIFSLQGILLDCKIGNELNEMDISELQNNIYLLKIWKGASYAVGYVKLNKM